MSPIKLLPSLRGLRFVAIMVGVMVGEKIGLIVEAMVRAIVGVMVGTVLELVLRQFWGWFLRQCFAYFFKLCKHWIKVPAILIFTDELMKSKKVN